MDQITGRIPDWLIVVIALFGIAVVAVIVIALLRRLAKAGKIKLWGIEIDSAAPDRTPNTIGCNENQEGLLRELENRLTSIYRNACQIIRHYMRNTIGIPKDSLENNVDFQYACALLWKGIYGKNGKHSVRTIIEDRIEHEDYLLDGETDPVRFITKRRKFMKGVTEQAESEIQDLFNKEYDNLYSVFDAESGQAILVHRSLIRETLADLIKAYVNGDLSSAIEGMFFGGDVES